MHFEFKHFQLYLIGELGMTMSCVLSFVELCHIHIVSVLTQFRMLSNQIK